MGSFFLFVLLGVLYSLVVITPKKIKEGYKKILLDNGYQDTKAHRATLVVFLLIMWPAILGADLVKVISDKVKK